MKRFLAVVLCLGLGACGKDKVQTAAVKSPGPQACAECGVASSVRHACRFCRYCAGERSSRDGHDCHRTRFCDTCEAEAPFRHEHRTRRI